jgi:hypothetical protein
MPTSGEGLLDKGAPSLKPVPAMKHVHTAADRCDKGVCDRMHTPCSTHADCFVRATQPVLDGLQKLDGILDTSSEYKGYSVEVTNCWRDGVNESKEECWDVMKGVNPVTERMMAWPGANPHSSGHACDLYLHKNGREVLHHGAHDKKRDVCENQEDARDASKVLDELLTNAGAERLIYEPWHFEWGGGGSCRCTAPACNRDFWPPHCTSDQCSKKHE